MKKIISSMILLHLLTCIVRGDCEHSKGFVSYAFKADLVALVTIESDYFHGHILNVVHILRGKVSSESILVWSNSPCNQERDSIEGDDGDTLLVALYKLRDDEICDSKYLKIVEKSGETVFVTNECETNVLKMENGNIVGQITNNCGTFEENGEMKYYPYIEEVLPYDVIISIVSEIK